MSVIIIVLPKLDNAKNIKRILLTHGFQSAVACSSGASALQMAGQYECGIVLSGYHLSDMYYVELMENLPESYELVLLGSPEKVADAGSGTLALTTPLKSYDLLNTVEMVLGQIEHRYRKRKVIKKRSAKEENYIRNAKYLLMERNHLTEQEAYRYLQKSSMDNGTNMVETAQMVLLLMFRSVYKELHADRETGC